MPYGIEKKICIDCKNYFKHKSMPLGENDPFWEVKPGGIHIYYWTLKGHYALLSLPLQNSSVYKNYSMHEQDRECTYNVTLRSVRVTTVSVENKYYIF
jgi:hypothetical protein